MGRVQTLLSHYYQPDIAQDVAEAALEDWVRQLRGYSEGQLQGACEHYLQSQPSRRPTPAEIRNRVTAPKGQEAKPGQGDRNKLSRDHLHLLDEQILPTARRWVSETPKGTTLHDQGQKTLEYWGDAAE